MFCILIIVCFLIRANKSGKKIGDEIKYGDTFVLSINDELLKDDGKSFYLHSEPISQSSRANSTRAQQVLFHNKNDYNAVWSFQYGDISMRIEYEKTQKVSTNDLLVIEHIYTKQMLACDKKFIQSTDFGNEYELICQTYHPNGRISTMKNELEGLVGDSRFQLSQNLWKIVDSSAKK